MLAQAWAEAVDEIGKVRDEATTREAEYRKAVRDAIATAAEPPARSPELDPAHWEARIAVAVEDAAAVRDDLSECVIEALALLRERRSDLQPHLGQLSAPLLAAIQSGPGNQTL